MPGTHQLPGMEQCLAYHIDDSVNRVRKIVIPPLYQYG